MTKVEENALRALETLTDPSRLRKMRLNAQGKSELVEKAAFRRLIAISTKFEPGTVQHDCWAMVHTIEKLRRASGRKVSRMNHMRPKIEKVGEIAALEYCSINRTDGFDEIIKMGVPDLAAEAIVLKHPQHFSEKALNLATTRLAEEGFAIDTDGEVVRIGA